MADAPDIDGRTWLGAFAAELGTAAPTDSEIDTLLDLAGVAAHDSERIAAPIACWLIGREGIDPDVALARARAFVESRGS